MSKLADLRCNTVNVIVVCEFARKKLRVGCKVLTNQSRIRHTWLWVVKRKVERWGSGRGRSRKPAHLR